MLDAGIGKDDIMIIDRSKTPKHGDIVMADLGRDLCKRVLLQTAET